MDLTPTNMLSNLVLAGDRCLCYMNAAVRSIYLAQTGHDPALADSRNAS